MNKNTFIKVLLPIVAVVVIIEAVVLVTNLQKKDTVVSPAQTNVQTQQQAGSLTAKPEVKESVLDLEIDGNQTMVKGKASPVSVVLNPKGDYKLDAINLFVKYDPQKFDLKNMKFDNKLPKPNYSKFSTKKGLVVVNYMISAKDGFAISQGEKLSLVSFDAVPKDSGNFEFEINTGNEAKESATMFVETESSKVLPFSANKLAVSVN